MGGTCGCGNDSDEAAGTQNCGWCNIPEGKSAGDKLLDQWLEEDK